MNTFEYASTLISDAAGCSLHQAAKAVRVLINADIIKGGPEDLHDARGYLTPPDQ